MGCRWVRVSARSRKAEVVNRIRTPVHALGGGHSVGFLLPNSDGYWLGLRGGMIAYRRDGSVEPQRNIQLK